MFRFVGSALGHAKLLTLAGVTASSVAVAPAAVHAFHSPAIHNDHRTFDGDRYQESARGNVDHDRFDGSRFDHDRIGRSGFDRHVAAECRESHSRPLDNGHRGFHPFRG